MDNARAQNSSDPSADRAEKPGSPSPLFLYQATTYKDMSKYLTSQNVCLPGQAPAPATIEYSAESGKILAITPSYQSVPPASQVDLTDVGEAFVLPGLVDCHVHLNEPGRTEWEGFATGSHAAASGGVTTIVDVSSALSLPDKGVESLEQSTDPSVCFCSPIQMPLNSIPPTTTVSGLGELLSLPSPGCRVR